MANLWLRLYHDMPNDPKWRTIARVSKQPIPLVLAVYLHLLVIASQATDRGAVMNVNPEDIASALDADSAAIEAVLVGMDGRVIDEERLSGWDKRQVAREDGASERAKKWRENRTQSNATERERTNANANERQIKSREEEIKIKAKTKPSRAKKPREVRNKPPCKTDLAKVRHREFKAAIGLYWNSKNPGVEMPWGAPEGQALEIWLRESPNTSIDQFTGFLRHRFKSDANHTERPSMWIRKITSYANEPLDRFGAPKSLKGIANGKPEYAKNKSDRTLDALRASLAADDQGRTGSAGDFAQGRVIEGGTGSLRGGAGELGDGRPSGRPEIVVAAT